MMITPVEIDYKDAKSGLKFWMNCAILMAISAELLHKLLFGEIASLALLPNTKWQDLVMFMGTFAGVPACLLWIGAKNPIRDLRWNWLAIVVGAAMAGYLMAYHNSEGLYSSTAVIIVVLGPLGLLSTLVCLASSIFKSKAQLRGWRNFYLQIAILLASLSVGTNAALRNTRMLFPATWDYFIYRIDGAFGGVATQAAIVNAQGSPFLQTFTFVSYAMLIIALYVLVGVAIRKDSVARLHVWRTLVLPFAIAFVLYAWLPLSGPIYTFFDGRFPAALPSIYEVAASQVVIPPSSRNGMPSMHLTGALLVWMLAIGLRHRVSILFSSVLVLATIWSTLASGEHYLLDLVVALPYAAFLSAALIWPQYFRRGWKVSGPIWFSGIIFFIWLIILRLIPQWLALNPWTVRIFAGCSAVSASYVYWQIILLARSRTSELHVVNLPAATPFAVVKTPLWIVGVFTASGVAGLIYEVVYAKALAVTFGSTSLASYTVLATYMGGMALGAWLGGYAADRLRNPLRGYAICEAIIGIYAAFTPNLFKLIQDIYVSLSADAAPDANWLTVVRVGLGIFCLGLPTVLMGTTMPLMFKHLRELGVASSGAIPKLYGANVAGAALGSLIAGYFLLPAVGRNGGTFIAAVMSLMIALYALDRIKQTKPITLLIQEQQNNDVPAVNPVHKWVGITALIILFIGGVVTLGLEVNFIHLLAVVAGNSVYAFALMLAAFLAGLGLGSHAGERLIQHFSRLDVVACAQCGVALAIGITAHTWDNIPSYFGSFDVYPVNVSFSARETIRALVCGVAMVPAAFFIGLSYPASMSLASDWLSPKGGARGLGLSSALNTLGNILGVVIVGFWLLPSYGSRNSAFLLAFIALSLGVMALLVSKKYLWPSDTTATAKFLYTIPVVAASAALYVFPSQWNYDDLSTGSNVYFKTQNWGKVIDHAESVEGGLTSVTKNSDGVLTLLTNGKFQGNDASGGEMVAQESFALFPLLHTAQRDRALVIGYGTGMTARVLHEFEFKKVDVAELSKDIVTMANRHFGSINHLVTELPDVQMHFTDGRNYLLTQSSQFDLISIEITSIWFAGAANLYNKDFYAIAKKRLTNKGVLQQWVQLHHISPIDLSYVMGSVRSEFKYVWLYVRGGQGIIIASNNADSMNLPGQGLVADKFTNTEDGRHPTQLRSNLILSPAGVDNFISTLDPTMSQLVSTDSNLYLEHATPKGNALGNVVSDNINLLSRFETAK
jgi:predicted membrane-bound spermidine synthase